jgi:integrase
VIIRKERYRLANKTNCVINGIPYYRLRRKVGLKLNNAGEWVDDIKPFYGKSKKDAENKYSDYIANQKSGVKNENEYFNHLMHYWVYQVFMNGNHSEGTKQKYECAYRLYIQKCSLSNYLMSEISGKSVQNFFNELVLTASQLNAIKKILALFFKYADSEGYCRNPMVNISIRKPTRTQNEIVVFSKTEIGRILKSNPNSRNATYRFLFLLGLGTGLRQGELLGLKYSDIKDGKINVVRQISTGTDKIRREYDTKSQNSVRQVPIPEYLLPELEEHNKKRINDYVFCTSTGKLIDKSNLIFSWHRFLDSIGVEYKEFHTLRRTYCTMLCESGIPIQVASQLMGHSSVAVTAKYYAFVSDKTKEKAAEQINGIFNQKFYIAKKGKKIKKSNRFKMVKKWLSVTNKNAR